MSGWLSLAALRASLRNRSTRPWLDLAIFGGSILMATDRCRFVSNARYTTPNPPLPIRLRILKPLMTDPTRGSVLSSLRTEAIWLGVVGASRPAATALAAGARSAAACAMDCSASSAAAGRGVAEAAAGGTSAGGGDGVAPAVATAAGTHRCLHDRHVTSFCALSVDSL